MSGFRALALSLLAGPGWAGDVPLTGEAFEAFVSGKAFTYSRNGVVFGTETYRSQRRLLWLGADGICLEGNWFAQDGQICFVYEIDGTGVPRVCAPIIGQGDTLRAEEADGGLIIGVLADAPDLSACLGPKVGA